MTFSLFWNFSKFEFWAYIFEIFKISKQISNFRQKVKFWLKIQNFTFLRILGLLLGLELISLLLFGIILFLCFNKIPFSSETRVVHCGECCCLWWNIDLVLLKIDTWVMAHFKACFLKIQSFIQTATSFLPRSFSFCYGSTQMLIM